MKRKYSILVLCAMLSFHQQLQAQETKFITHTLKSGETLSALAKQYNTNVGDIMRLNGWHADSKLVIGEKIKIAAVTDNTAASQVDTASKQLSVIIIEKPAGAATYTVVKGDNLFKISQKFKISVDNLETWNHLTDGNVKVGQMLIVGNNDVAKSSNETSNANIYPNNTIGKKEEDSQLQSDTSGKTLPEEKNSGENNVTTTEDKTNSINAEGNTEDYFSVSYANNTAGKSLQNIAGTAMTFKTTSGWADKKYYIIINNIAPGSVVKVTASNGKVLYAKVLWSIESIKHSKNINCFISNAAAAALEMNHPEFDLNISYYN